jgi:hypothetical protein
MKRFFHLTVLASVLLGVPALCAWLGGFDEIWEGVRSFPPRTEDWGFHPEKLWNHRCPFSWGWFAVLALFTFVSVRPLAARALRLAPHETQGMRAPRHPSPFPWWGWAGLAELATAWVFAWAKFDVCRPFQPHISYFPLWIGYILVVNALCVKRSGTAPLLAHPGPYLLTFPASAFFWWFFEYLNRYVWNWYYLGIAEMSAAEYTFYATLCFSSVLPAVAATAALLHTFEPFRDGRYDAMWRLDIRRPRPKAFLAAAGLLGLSGIVFAPQYTYPLLWLSPLMAFLLVQILLGEPCVLDRLRTGNWSLVFRFAMAALVCGLAWETWNYYAVAKWVYAVPWVHRFQIWEMPLLGFAGYLPFGVECAAVTFWICPELVDA